MYKKERSHKPSKARSTLEINQLYYTKQEEISQMEHIPGYDEWKTTPPEQVPATYCDCCGCEVYEGDYIYTIDGERLCEDCLNANYRRVV